MPMVAGSGRAFKSVDREWFCLWIEIKHHDQPSNNSCTLVENSYILPSVQMAAANITKVSARAHNPKNLQTASAKGQVTIPVNIRKALGIIAGTPVRFVERDGLVVLEKVDVNLSSLCGIVTARQSASRDEMRQAIGDAVAERFERVSASR